MSSRIRSVRAIEILESRGMPTLRVFEACFQLDEQRRFATPARTVQHEMFAVAQSCNHVPVRFITA